MTYGSVRTDQLPAHASILPANFFQTDMARLRSRSRSSLVDAWPADPGPFPPLARPVPGTVSEEGRPPENVVAVVFGE